MKFIKFLLGTFFLIFGIIILVYTVYSLKCFEKRAVAVVNYEEEIKGKAFVYNTCFHKIIDSFNLDIPTPLKTNSKSAKLAKFFELKDMNKSIDKMLILTNKVNGLKKEAKDKLNIDLKYLNTKTIYQALINKIKLENKIKTSILAIDKNFYKVYSIKDKTPVNFDFVDDILSTLHFNENESINKIELRKYTLSLLYKLKEYPYDFASYRVEFISSLISKKTINKNDIMYLLETEHIDLAKVKYLLFLFAFMESFHINVVYQANFPYAGFTIFEAE